MSYDDWKNTPPDDEPAPGEHRSYDDECDCDECEADHYEESLRRQDEEYERRRCVLGERCLAADPFHTSDECFDAEMAEAYMAPEHEGAEQP